MCFKRMLKKLFNCDFSKEVLFSIELLSKNKKLPMTTTTTTKSITQFDIIHQSIFFLTENERASLNFNSGCTVCLKTYKCPFWDASSLGHSDLKSFVFFASALNLLSNTERVSVMWQISPKLQQAKP